MLLSRDSRHGLKPMCEMSRALFDGPVLHGVCDHNGGVAVEPFSVLHGALDLLEHLFRQTLAHNGIIEYHAPKRIDDCAHIANLISV